MTNPSYLDRKRQLVSVFNDTLQRIGNSRELQAAVSQSIASQQYISDADQINLPAPPYTEKAQVVVSRLRSFEAAARYPGQKVTVLNFASSTSPGGGVENGASAQEECLCRVSTLYPCLKTKTAWDKFYGPHRAAPNPLHNDDLIYTKDVVVLKDDDYNVLSSPFRVDVITCAAPNLRESPSNRYNRNDGDAVHISPERLLELHVKRARKILSAAAANGAEVLILGAFGCGAFRNDPAVVAAAYHQVLPQFLNHFKTIEFAVYCSPRDLRNYDAFTIIRNAPDNFLLP
ncbi:MAG: TIGR02452 family protein [Bacteroidales bacterium]|nr:TIGR02452 family protein [Bacteroidales bacterium]MBO7586816.1 TIGR02452 family protein [Bacteroidales bacterium]